MSEEDKRVQDIASAVATAVTKSIMETVGSSMIVANDICYIKGDISEIKDAVKELSNTYVLRAEYEPIKRLVYGAVGIILTMIVGAMVVIILK